MVRLVIRWTFGENRARPLSPQALDMLEMSIKFAKLLFPKARFIVCYNNLKQTTLNALMKIVSETGVEAKDVTNLLPSYLARTDVKNSWWKYAIPRLDEKAYEILMDNDVVLWRIPPTLERAIKEQALVALTDAAGQYYGDFHDLVMNLNPKLKLNAGLLGMPPSFKVDFGLIQRVKLRDFFHSEQGFTALNFLLYNGKKYLIPLEEVVQLNIIKVPPEELIARYCGGHFAGCSYAHFDFWEKKYSQAVKNYYRRLTTNE